MAEQCTATSPPLHAWWDLHHATSLSSWADDLLSISTSLTNASNHSVLTSVDDSSGRRLDEQPHPSNELISGEHGSDNHLWSRVILSNVGSNGGLNHGVYVGENLFEAMSSKSNSSAAGIFEPACDYLDKIDGNWELSSSSVFNSLVRNMNQGFDNDQQSSIGSERLTKLSNMVSHGSIAPQFMSPKPSTSSPVENYSGSLQQPTAFCGMETVKNPVFLSCYGHGNPKSISMEADNFYGSVSHSPCTTNITYGRLSKPLIHIHAPSKPRFRHLNLSDCKEKGLQAANSPQTRSSNGRTQGIANEGKNKRGDETSGSTTTVLKKPKHENSAASSVKMHAPKVKLGDKITALQQIVSPFGKTDTASVLLEAIGYINFLQEQVQLLSNPYMKSNSLKDPWGSLDRKDEKGDGKVDLRSRGLCLVPKVYHESTGSDYWSPTYRGCLYR
ncbi:hypothetical protein GQ457_03G010860 [Hibiscus cannabinus]